jgi:hypothetical protein
MSLTRDAIVATLFVLFTIVYDIKRPKMPMKWEEVGVHGGEMWEKLGELNIYRMLTDLVYVLFSLSLQGTRLVCRGVPLGI